MKKVRNHRGSQKVDLYPTQQTCPKCGQPRREKYRKAPYVVTLAAPLHLVRHVLHCQTQDCPGRGTAFRPDREGALALPQYTFGWDVVARIGQWRYDEHLTVPRIAAPVRAGGLGISLKEVQRLSEVFLARVETTITDDQPSVAQLQEQGGLLLALDGVQQENGHQTRWLWREVRSGRVRVARHPWSSGSRELAPLIGEVKLLDVPILGGISDKRESWCLAVAKELPGVPHQWCHYPDLHNVAQPVCDAARKLKKQLEQTGRGIREVERQIAAASRAEGQVGRGYCLALREVMREEGK